MGDRRATEVELCTDSSEKQDFRSRSVRTESSDLSVSTCSEARRAHLEDARHKAIQSRRTKQLVGLQQRVREVRELLGDMDSAQVERSVQFITDNEIRLRKRQSELTESMTEALKAVHKEMTTIQKMLGRVSSLEELSRRDGRLAGSDAASSVSTTTRSGSAVSWAPGYVHSRR
jgi:hypothetical protein